MKNISKLSSLLLILASCQSVKTYNNIVSEQHSIVEMKKDVDFAYKKLNKLHPKLDLYISKEQLDYKFDSLKKSFTSPLTSYEFYLRFSPVIASIKQGHTSISAPKRKMTKDEKKLYKDNNFKGYNFDFTAIENKVFVSYTDTVYKKHLGAELLAINGSPIQEIKQKYKPTFASDGFNTTFPNKFLAKGIVPFYNRDKYRTDSISYTFKKNDSVYVLKFIKAFHKTNNERISDSLLAAKRKTETTKPIQQATQNKKTNEKKSKNLEKIAGRDYSIRSLTFLDRDSTIAVLKIRSFMGGNYKKFYSQAFEKLKKLQCKNLIIDIRDNLGGRAMEIRSLSSYLFQQPIKVIEKAETKTRVPITRSVFKNNNPVFQNIILGLFTPLTVIDYLHSSKKNGVLYYSIKINKSIKPQANNYSGNLYVVVNGTSFSASAVLAANLKGNKRATIVGEETGGAYNETVAGIMKGVRLPNTYLNLNFGLLNIKPGVLPLIPEGRGVIPDVEIKPTIENFQKEKDVELDWIFDAIKKK